jgi:hypothetical protein
MVRPCNRGRGSVYDLHALPTRDIRGRTPRQHEMRGGCSLRGRAWIFVVENGGASVSADRPGSRRFATMAQIESKHDVRRKVRDAQGQVNRERLKREADNREDMVGFLVAEQKLSAVSQWEAERHAQVRLEAEQRRAEQRLEGARALARMRDRGETVADIAQLGGCSVKLVRRYLKELQAAAPVSGIASGNGSRTLGSDGAAVASDVSQALDGGGADTAVEVESSTTAAGVGGHP